MPDLRKLREGWKTEAKLPSLPSQTEASTQPKNSSVTSRLPELPAIAAAASDAAMSMDTETIIPPSAFAEMTPIQEPSAGLSDMPEIPAMPQAPSKAASIPSRPVPMEMAAMPSEHVPEISLPLVRDLIQRHPDMIPGESETLAEPLSNQAKFDPAEDSETSGKDDKPSHPNKDRRPFAEVDAPAQFHTPSKDRPEYTDEDLRSALAPIISPQVDHFLHSPSFGLHRYLEPMLRSTVRRAIAEQMDDASPFKDATGWDKLNWKLRALFSGRTYDDVVFSSTKRYQVEEVFLLRLHTRSLVSYASNDPSRHVKPAKVQSTVRKLSSLISKNGNKEKKILPWKDKRQLAIRRGEHCILIAIIHGESNALLKSDLDYALRQAEERFGATLEEENDLHLQVLQPLLEGCLLIQSPVVAN